MATSITGYRTLALGQAYQFPPGLTGRGQRVGIIELAGGYTEQGLDTFFGSLGMATPHIMCVEVDGGANAPDTKYVQRTPDGEVDLDIEVAGALAPEADFVVYFCRNTLQGIVAATERAVADGCTVVMNCWGQREDLWPLKLVIDMEKVLRRARDEGMTVVCSSGDLGPTCGVADGRAVCMYPASSPLVLAVGGTTLELDAQNQVLDETAWCRDPLTQASGGGHALCFPVPGYQQPALEGLLAQFGLSSKWLGRGVPDIAADADPYTGYEILVDDRWEANGGTSASTPLIGALIARLAEGLGRRPGFINPALYAMAQDDAGPDGARALRDITRGSTGLYEARVGWDELTGLGVPVGAELLSRLRS